MKGLIVGIGKGTYGNGSTPLTLDNIYKIFEENQTITNITEIDNRSYNDLQDLPTLNITDWNTAFEWGDHSTEGYLTSTDLNGYATETWVSSNFDNYNYWRLGGNGSYTNIGSTESVNFVGNGVSRSDNTINIEQGGNQSIDNDVASGFYTVTKGKTFVCNGSNVTVDIPDGSFVGDWCRLINNGSNTAVRFSPANAATINGVNAAAFVPPEGGELVIICTGNNTWETYGDLRDSGNLYEPIGKEIKEISSSTYTIIGEDHNKWLKFTNNCTVTVPNLASRYLIEGETDDGVTISFQSQSGVTLRKLSSIGLTLSPNGVFGIKYSTSINALIYGTDPI